MFKELVKQYVKDVKSGKLRGPLWLMPTSSQIGAAMFMWGRTDAPYAAAKLFWLFYEYGNPNTWLACEAIVEKVGLEAFHKAVNPPKEIPKKLR